MEHKRIIILFAIKNVYSEVKIKKNGYLGGIGVGLTMF